MERRISVLKFGGTSVGNGERIRQVAQIVARQAQQQTEDFPAVVVSAMAGVTDQLLRITRSITIPTADTEERARDREALKRKHLDAAEIVAQTPHERSRLLGELDEAFAAFEHDLQRLYEARQHADLLPLRTAAVAAWGERLAVLLVASALRTLGLEAEAIREEVICIEAPRHEVPYLPGTVIGADPLDAQTWANAQRLVMPLVERGVVPVMAGFLGRTQDGIVATLGRNGSDYSAAVIGAALDCKLLEIYTDVDGVLSADPRIVPNARLLPQLSYTEAAQLSWFGAKVLHPRTLIPLAQRHIPVRVRNTFRPHARGTIVGPTWSMSKQYGGATALTVRRHLALITVESRHPFSAPANVGQVFDLATHAGIIPVAICSSYGQHLAFLVEEHQANAIVELLHQKPLNWRATSRAGLAACACIGSGFVQSPMSPAQAITTLAGECISVVAQGASDLGTLLIIEDRDSERALRSLHRDLIAPVIPLVHNQRSQHAQHSYRAYEARS